MDNNNKVNKMEFTDIKELKKLMAGNNGQRDFQFVERNHLGSIEKDQLSPYNINSISHEDYTAKEYSVMKGDYSAKQQQKDQTEK